MTTIVFPGSFNPFTLGHSSLVERALPLCDRLVIALGANAAKGDGPDVQQRLDHLRRLYAGQPKVQVTAYSTLTIDLCRSLGARWILRGVRSVADYEYERAMADINLQAGGVDTLLLYSLPQYSHISSSMVRELASYGHDVSPYLPPLPENA